MKIQLKRSNQLDGTTAKEPTADQMEYGELAVNYNDDDPAIFLKGNDNTIIRIAGKGAAGLDGDYVNATGDNMTGDLTLGTNPAAPNITLNTAGSINAAGDITSTTLKLQGSLAQSTIKTDGGDFVVSTLDSSGGTFAERLRIEDGNGSATFTNAVNVGSLSTTSGGVSVAEGKITLSATGRAFAEESFRTGSVSTGSSSSAGANLYGVGSLDIQRSSSGTIFRGLEGTSENVTISSDGSITTAGNITNNGTTLYPNGSADFHDGSIRVNGDGDLLIGTTSYVDADANIALSDDGSGTFAGKITSLGNAEGGAENGATINQGSGYSASFSADSSLLYRGYKTGNSTPTFSVAVDGSANFAGLVKTNSFSSGDLTNGPYVYGTSTGNLDIWTGGNDAITVKDNSGTQTALIQASGSASFAGDVTAKSLDVTQSGTGYTYIGRQADGTATFSVYQDGAASFGGISIGAGADKGTQIYSQEGIATVTATGTQGWDLYQTGVSTAGVSLKANGTADFAGDGTFGGRLTFEKAEIGSYLSGDGGGRLNTYGSAAAAANSVAFQNVIADADGSNQKPTINFRKDGVATFGSTPESGTLVGVKLYGDIGSIGITGNVPGQNLFLGYTQGNQSNTVAIEASGKATFAGKVTASNVTFNLQADDDTKYTSTTDSEGVVTRVYNGTTLDVKDRLQKVDAALLALKTAAAAASDFTTLKSAIATALVNI